MGQMNEISIDKARELVGNAALWPRIRDFLWNFAPQVHPSWLEGMPVGEVPGVMSSPRVKRYILDALGAEQCFHVFPKDDFSRLLLLDGATLFEIVKWIGTIACARQLRRVTDGATVRSLKAALPGVYPEAFGFTAYFAKWTDKAEVDNSNPKISAEAVPAAGCKILFALLESLPKPLLRRLELKLPKDVGTSGGELVGESQVAVYDFQFVAKLLKLRFPEAFSLCC